MNVFHSQSRHGRASILPATLLLFLLPAVPLSAPAAEAPPLPARASETAAAFGTPLTAQALEALRGGDQVENRVLIDGTVEGNSAEAVVSGDNRVQGGAFGNAAGINTLIQNTGSNVLIQHGMTVNVRFADPGVP